MAIAGFIVLLLATYVAYIKLFRVDVVFYASLFAGLIAAVIAGLALVPVTLFNSFEKVLLVLVMCLGAYAFAISVPTVIDRSLSFYILEKLQQRGGGIRLDRMDEVFTDEYLKEHRLMEIRITEQIESGTILVDGGCVRLTPRGDTLASMSTAFRRHFLPKKRLVAGEYTDDLTAPFRDAGEVPDYGC